MTISSQLTRSEAFDIFDAINNAADAANKGGDLDLEFQLDGAARILIAKLFPSLPGDT